MGNLIDLGEFRDWLESDVGLALGMLLLVVVTGIVVCLVLKRPL